MSGAIQSLTHRLAPAAAARVISEFFTEIITGQSVANGHPALADLRSLPIHERALGNIIEAMAPGRGTPNLASDARAMLSSVLDPALVQLSKAYPQPVHRAFCSVQVVPDFKEQGFMGAFDGLRAEPVGENGEIPITLAGGAQYELERGTVRQYGRLVRIPRQAIINDGSGGFFRNTANAMLAACFRAEAGQVYGTLEANPTMADGAPLFDASNSISKSSVITALQAGFALLAAQQFPSGEYADVEPGVLVIPAGWSIQISDTLSDIALSAAYGGLRIIKTGRIQHGYLLANPARHPALVLSGLSEDVMPNLDVNTNPRISLDVGLELRVLHAFGVVPVSRCGIVQMTLG